MAKRLRDRITARTQHAIDNAFRSTAMALLLEERDGELRQCKWMLKNGYFPAADYETTGRN
jgi:hypothetical protein